MEANALRRMPYAYICFNAAKLAKKLGYDRISVIEYGVGGGAGLLSLEEYTDEIKKILGVQIDIYGLILEKVYQSLQITVIFHITGKKVFFQWIKMNYLKN